MAKETKKEVKRVDKKEDKLKALDAAISKIEKIMGKARL